MKFKGIFDTISDEFHPGISDKIKAIKDQMIYASQSPRAKQLDIDPKVEKGLNFNKSTDDSLPLESMTRDPFASISKVDMPIDPKHKKDKLMDAIPKKQEANKSQEDDLMRVESKKWKEKFNLGFDV
ncbi:hypothetical protein [Ekhidna sp.]|uniref:hypothetical protein n=1 Tax=Ekhidna sp. TaxID=2608089 RepID=UPI003BAC5498